MSRANPRYHRTNTVPPPPTGNVWHVKIKGSIEGQMTISNFYYEDTQTPGSGTLAIQQALFNGLTVVGNLVPKYEACLSVDWVANSIIIDSPNNQALAAYVQPWSTAAGGPTGHEPTEVAAVILKQTSLKGQCGRGRVELPAVPTAWVGSSQLTTTTAYQALAGQMIAQVVNGGYTFTPGIYSRGTRQVRLPGFTALVSCAVTTLLGTIRRRKIGRGK